MQDVANIFVYLPRKFDLPSFIAILVVFVSMLGLICYIRGGKIQKIVSSKTNTKDIRSASIINLLYGFILIIFKEMSSIPMSTTWVFIGLLAGREIALHKQLKHRKTKKVWTRTGECRI